MALDIALFLLGLDVNAAVGGGGTPAWLPAGALAFADFKNGNYYANGATTTLTAMWVQNTDWQNFHTNNVVAGVGLQGSISSSPVLADTIASALLSGFTAVVTGQAPAETGMNVSVVDLPNFNGETDIKIATYVVNDGLVGNFNGESSHIALNPATGGFKTAGTISPTVNAASADGAVAVSITPDGNSNTHIAMTVLAGTMESIAFYAPVAAAGLPALSAL